MQQPAHQYAGAAGGTSLQIGRPEEALAALCSRYDFLALVTASS
jgi:hypothetical protein